MAWKLNFIIIAILSCLFIALWAQLYLPVIKGPPLERRESSETVNNHKGNRRSHKNGRSQQNESSNMLAVIVPYRDRFEELQIFAPYIHSFLNRQNIPHVIFIVNQIDTYRFNRAALINVGYKHAKLSANYMVMHDVDLLPLNDNLSYEKPQVGHVMHIAAPGLHPKYDYPTFIGGILIISKVDFLKVNGMSNIYWGWGLEDDEFYVRLKQSQIKVLRPTVTTNKTNTFKHIHSKRPRDTTKCFDQYNKLRKRDRQTGLSNVNYTLVSTTNMVVEETPVTVLNIRLHCDKKISPWCICGSSASNNLTH